MTGRLKRRVEAVCLILALCIFFAFPAFSLTQEDILSPVQGEWNNVQALVIDNREPCGIYYSLTGSDPLVSGFAYDRPVVIEETGDVKIRITAVYPDSRRDDFTVEYTVKKSVTELEEGEASAESSQESAHLSEQGKAFIDSICQNPLRNYISGDTFPIPKDFKYSFFNGDKPTIQGTELFIDKRNLRERYMPCTIEDSKGSKWHFVIHVVPSLDNKESITSEKLQQDLPFMLTDWENFYYTGTGLIYQIDDLYWSGVHQKIVLDRSVPHTVSFQSISFEKGNPITTYTIPPMPKLKKETTDGGGEVFSIDESWNGVPFLIGPSRASLSATNVSKGFYKKIYADTFFGDEIKDGFTAGIYYGGIYQGPVKVECTLDKFPPKPPVIHSAGKYKRGSSSSSIVIEAPEGDAIFYSVSEPVVSEEGFSGASEKAFNSVKTGEFKAYSGNPVELNSVNENATFYKIQAYCQDKKGNKSGLAEYRVILDECSFYVNASAPSGENVDMYEEGSYEHPFTSLEQAAEAINGCEYAILHVQGDVPCSTEIEIKRDCLIIGFESSIEFTGEGSLSISDSKVSFKDLNISKRQSSKDSKNLLQIKNSNVEFENCELSGVFPGDGILIDSLDSNLTFTATGLTVNSQNYSSCLSSSGGKIVCRNVRSTSSSLDSVNFNVIKGDVDVKNSDFSIIANLGCAIELVKSKASLEETISMQSFPPSQRPMVQSGTKQIHLYL
ncbi:MAG: hypothetical protein J5817_11860 [Treponema sp.]|nr:hypothetical protein [Treponema sp.]